MAPRRRAMRAGRIAVGAGIRGGEGRGKRVLDVGCGTAAYTLPLSEQTEATLVGVDVTPETLQQASRKVPGNVRLAGADAVRLPFRDGAFDAVVGNAVLHHLPLARAIPELLRVLKPGGRFCFAEPNLLNPHVFVLLRVPALRRRAGVTPDETAFVRGPLRRTLERLGLEAVDVSPFDFLYPAIPAGWIDAVVALGSRLEATPLVREIAGSLLIRGRKPA